MSQDSDDHGGRLRGHRSDRLPPPDSAQEREPSRTANGSKPTPEERTQADGGLDAGLYIVATPIGNLRDITLRALDVIAAADVVLCEDTRVTRTLLERYAIKRRLGSYHEHNAARARPGILRRLRDGARVALLADAGTPLVSDPGYKLAAEAAEEGISVIPIPGPSAVLAALVAAGLPTDRFLFLGFLPAKRDARRTALREVQGVRATLVVYESTRRLAGALEDLTAVLGDRPAAVMRELTKRHEEARRGPLSELAGHYAREGPPRGEAVVVVGPPGEEAAPTEADLDRALSEALASMSVKEAAGAVADMLSLPRRRVYARALELNKAEREAQ